MPYVGGWIIFLDFGDSYRILEACDLVCLITGARGGDGVGDGDAHYQQHQGTRRHPQYSSWKWRRKNIRPMDGLLLLTAAGECQEHENDFQFWTNCWMHPDKDSNCAQLRKLLWILADKNKNLLRWSLAFIYTIITIIPIEHGDSVSHKRFLILTPGYGTIIPLSGAHWSWSHPKNIIRASSLWFFAHFLPFSKYSSYLV